MVSLTEGQRVALCLGGCVNHGAKINSTCAQPTIQNLLVGIISVGILVAQKFNHGAL